MSIEEYPFSELISVVIDNRGRTCPTTDSGIPLIATNCIRNELLYPTYDKVRFVSKETYSTWFRGHPLPGDIIFVNKATPGRVCLVPDPVNFCIAQDMVAVRADPKRVYPRFLFAVLRSPVVQAKIGQMHVGTLIPHFKKGDFDKLLLPIPEHKAQEFIGDAYFELSAKIDLNRRMCQTLEEMARALFKSWFVDFDPVRAKMEGRDPGLPKEIADLFPSRLVDSELGPIPEGWSAGHIGELATLNPESWTAKSRPGAVRYLDLASAKWGRFDEAQCLAGDAIPSRAQRVLKPGDSVLGTVRPGNGSFGLIHDDELTGSTGFAVLRPTATRNRVYVYLSVTAAENIDRLSRLADGGAYPAVRPDVVGATPCVHPPARLLEHVELIAGSWLDRVAACESESRSLAALRDTLLPKLISGEVRVPASLGSMQELSG
jgi:type I restriction enzyme S subunit